MVAAADQERDGTSGGTKFHKVVSTVVSSGASNHKPFESFAASRGHVGCLRCGWRSVVRNSTCGGLRT
jgi:hypothetical protein